MVRFKKFKEDERFIFYYYYPDGREDRKPGIIVVDKSKDEVEITTVAEGDWERNIPPEELNLLANEINAIKKERGENDFVKLATKSVHSTYFGDHAVHRICEFLREGVVPENGSVAWY